MLLNLKEFVAFMLDILIPRFVTDRCAVLHIDGKMEVVCREEDLMSHDIYDEIVNIKAFNFFGFGLFAKVIMNND